MAWDFALGAAVGLAGGLLGTRYLHVLESKETHHRDLRDRVLEDWRRYAEELRLKLTAYQLENWVLARVSSIERYWISHRGQVEDDAFRPNSTLWTRAAKHWPRETTDWQKIDGERSEVVKAIRSIVQDVEGRFPPDGSWTAEGVSPPAVGDHRLILVQKTWPILVRAHRRFSPEAPQIVVTPSGAHSFVEVNGSRWAKSDAAGASALAQTLNEIVGPGATRVRILELLSNADPLRQSLTRFLEDLDRMVFDKNLPRKCDFCPRFFRWP